MISSTDIFSIADLYELLYAQPWPNHVEEAIKCAIEKKKNRVEISGWKSQATQPETLDLSPETNSSEFTE